MPDRDEVKTAINSKLTEMAKSGQAPDVITFAGNGEPTIHPEFAGIIEDTLELRNKYFPAASVAVLSNSTTLGDINVREALEKVDQCILKLDSAINDTFLAHNQPKMKISAEDIISNLESFEGSIILQTMFIQGEMEGKRIDNTTDKELGAWLNALKRIRPVEVQIYTVSRDAPAGNIIRKVPREMLEVIAEKVKELGFKTQVSA